MLPSSPPAGPGSGFAVARRTSLAVVVEETPTLLALRAVPVACWFGAEHRNSITLVTKY